MPLGMSAADLANRIGVLTADVEQIVAEQAPIADGMAKRLGKYFGTSSELWMNLQTAYDHKVRGGAAASRR